MRLQIKSIEKLCIKNEGGRKFLLSFVNGRGGEIVVK